MAYIEMHNILKTHFYTFYCLNIQHFDRAWINFIIMLKLTLLLVYMVEGPVQNRNKYGAFALPLKRTHKVGVRAAPVALYYGYHFYYHTGCGKDPPF